MKAILNQLVCIAALITAIIHADAQTSSTQKDTLKLSKEQKLQKGTTAIKPGYVPPLVFIPYYYAPKPVKLGLPSSSSNGTSLLLLKNNTAESALSSINRTLRMENRQDKNFIIAASIVSAATWGGVIYQAVNGKKFSEEAQRKRSESKVMPVKRY